MKNLIILTAVVLLSPVLSKSQTASKSETKDPELNYIKTTYSKEKKTIVDEYMGLNVQEGAKFWAIYGPYEHQRETLAVARLKAIEDYVQNASNLTPAKADKIANAVLANSVSQAKMNQEYYTKMKTAVGAIKAAKFMQLETYLQTAWRGFVQENIPLISDLDKQKH